MTIYLFIYYFLFICFFVRMHNYCYTDTHMQPDAQMGEEKANVVCNTLASKLLYVAVLCCLLPSSSPMSLRQIKCPPCYMC